MFLPRIDHPKKKGYLLVRGKTMKVQRRTSLSGPLSVGSGIQVRLIGKKHGPPENRRRKKEGSFIRQLSSFPLEKVTERETGRKKKRRFRSKVKKGKE